MSFSYVASSKMAIEFNPDGSIKMPKPGSKKKIVIAEKVKKHNSVAVIDDKQSNTNPVVEMKCPKCKNKKAYFWVTQTRASDESETKFYKCTNSKCSHTWRVYR
jgi:transcription factor S